MVQYDMYLNPSLSNQSVPTEESSSVVHVITILTTNNVARQIEARLKLANNT